MCHVVVLRAYGRGRAVPTRSTQSTPHPSAPQARAAQLVEAAADDPFRLVVCLLPARAMSSQAVEQAVATLGAIAHAVRSRRAPLETLMQAIELIASTAHLRAEVLTAFERASRAKPSPAPRDWAALQARLPEVASRYTRLRRRGRLLVGRCPLHHDTRPSFTVYPNGTFFCFGCGQAGSVVHLLARVEGISLEQAFSHLLSQGGRGPQPL